MGRPCQCLCRDSIPPMPDAPLNFLVICVQDESSPYQTYVTWDEDLTYLRLLEHEMGAHINMVVVRPTGGQHGDTIKPDNRDFPEECLRVPEYTITRGGSSEANRAVFADIYNNIIKNDGVIIYQCIGVFIDGSGSLGRSPVALILDEFYWNLHQTTAQGSFVKYLDPLPACAGGNLSLGKGNGCIYEVLNAGERWIKHAADASKAMFEHPGGCSRNCLCTQGVPELCDAIGDVTQTSTTVTINYSFIKAGTHITEHPSDGGESTAVTVECTETGVTHTQFVTEVQEALAVWKAAIEHIASWVTVDFVNLGEESDNSVPSIANYSAIYPLPQGNVGDFRFGMHAIDGLGDPLVGNTIGHGYHPDAGSVLGSFGSIAGDFHFDVAEKWRMDGTSIEDSKSIKYVAVHEIGHVLGIAAPKIDEVQGRSGHLADEDAIMYWSITPSDNFDDKYPTGVVGSAPDLAALKVIYCIE